MAQRTGTVACFNNMKKFCFITTPGEADVFCHFRAIQSDKFKTLKQGETVEYEVEIRERDRPQAARVKRLTLEA